MIAEWLVRLLEPRENARIALVEQPIWRADFQPRDDLLDQLALAVWRQSRDDLLVIQDACRNERLLAAIGVRPKRAEVRQVRDWIDEAARAVSPPAERARNGQEHEQT